MTSQTRREGAPAVARAVRVLELIADHGGSMRMSDIAARLGIAKSSLHHVLGALIDVGWLERNETTKEVSLGIGVWEVGQAYEVAKTLSQRAQPFIDAVRDQLGETVRVALLSGTSNVCVAKASGERTLVFDQRVGARLPAHATGLGKALLSGLSDDEVRALYDGYLFEPFTEHTIMTVDDLVADLREARSRGFAEDRGEFILGIHCIAYPVTRRDGTTVAALSVSVPNARFDDEHRRRTLAALAGAADGLSQRLTAEVALA